MGKRMSREEKDKEILWEMYREAFKLSTPSADFDELVNNATTNEFGQKEIPFMDYECDEEVLENIVETTMKRHKVPTWRRKQFSVAFYLGCSPKTKRYE
jgi:hypothetical protein